MPIKLVPVAFVVIVVVVAVPFIPIAISGAWTNLSEEQIIANVERVALFWPNIAVLLASGFIILVKGLWFLAEGVAAANPSALADATLFVTNNIPALFTYAYNLLTQVSVDHVELWDWFWGLVYY